MEPLELSNALLWVVVLAQSIMILAILRKLDPLTAESSPRGAGISVGERPPPLALLNLNDRSVSLGKTGRPMIALFLSPACKVCRHAVTTLRELTPVRAEAENIFIIEGETEAVARIASDYDLDREFVVADSAGKYRRQWAIEERLPFLVALDETGIVVGAGSPTSREQLLTLIGGGAQVPKSVGEGTPRNIYHEYHEILSD